MSKAKICIHVRYSVVLAKHRKSILKKIWKQELGGGGGV